MRQSYNQPQDDGSRRSQCPPSHHKMALTPHYAQASARAPRPSPPSTHSPVLPGKVSPHHQQGSTTPWAASPAPLARADPPEYGNPPGRSVGLMAPSPMSFGASTPSYSPHSSVSFRSMGGEYTPTAWTTPPSDEATRHSRLTSSAVPTRQLVPPSQPHHCREGSRGPMAPSPATTEAAKPSPSLAHPFLPTRSSPSSAIPRRGGASLAEDRAATVLQCWKRRIWLCCWFDQQDLLKQKRLRLQALCRGALTYASSVRGNRRPPPAPTDKSSDPKVLHHPFRTRGQPLPPRKRGR